MSEELPADLSPLDPMVDPGRWEAVVSVTLRRVEAVLACRTTDPLSLIALWARPLLVTAATVLVLLVPVELALEAREERAEQVERLVSLSMAGSRAEAPLTGSDFLRALAGEEAP